MKFIDRIFSAFLGNDKQKFKEVHLDQDVVEEIIQISRETTPREFVALLSGKIRDQVMHIDGLIFLPGETSNEGAVMKIFMLPPMSGALGSVHSHPGYSAQPSSADLIFFAKNGFFHIIIAKPYTLESMVAYNSLGEEVSFKVV